MADDVLKHNARLGGRDVGSESTYRIRGTIAISELSIIYAARNADRNMKCIIKEFFPRALLRRGKDGRSVHMKSGMPVEHLEKLREAFLQEGKLLLESACPGVVRCLDQFEQNGTVYLVTEFVEGMTISEYIGGKPDQVDPGFFYRTMLPLIETLEHLHRKGIIHRDLKPGNVMIDAEGNAKLIDFGSAVRYKEASAYPIVTTKGYSPLELYSEQSQQGPVSDIYSLSALFYYCCRGTAPVDVRKRLFDDQIEPLSAGLKRSWPFLSRVVRRGLAVSPDKRCSSLKWFKAAITMEYMASPSGRLRSRRSG